MSELKFANDHHNPGLNLTVRKGIKWLVDQEIYIVIDGERVDISNAQKEVHTIGYLRDEDLALEHDPSCRTIEGLRAELEKHYGPVDDVDCVTMIYYDLGGHEKE
jgi:hypothetical protein